MKNDRQQTLVFGGLLAIAIWLLFFRKTEKCCGAAMMA